MTAKIRKALLAYAACDVKLGGYCTTNDLCWVALDYLDDYNVYRSDLSDTVVESIAYDGTAVRK